MVACISCRLHSDIYVAGVAFRLRRIADFHIRLYYISLLLFPVHVVSWPVERSCGAAYRALLQPCPFPHPSRGLPERLLCGRFMVCSAAAVWRATVCRRHVRLPVTVLPPIAAVFLRTFPGVICFARLPGRCRTLFGRERARRIHRVLLYCS